MKSAFNGYIKEIPFIYVDNFEDSSKYAYFLSHYHADHVFGLKSKDFPNKLKHNKGFIYGSAVTVAIVRNEFPALSPFLKVLDLGRNTVSITVDGKDIYLNVTVLPAGHSLGSVMYLFYYKETVLFTGDFRISPNTVETYTHLHKNGEPVHIDVMYVDTTFQDVAAFPRRSEVVRNVVEHVRDWLNRNIENTVKLITSAQFGYEYVCNEIYNVTGFKTYVNDNKWCIVRQFPKEMYGITNDPMSRIALTTKYEKAGYSLASPDVLLINFSAMRWGKNIEDENFLEVENDNRINVCFSTHCGRDELRHFINYLKPTTVIGFPQPYMAAVTSSEKCQLDFDISERSKPKRLGSEDENAALGKKISKDDIKSLFDW